MSARETAIDFARQNRDDALAELKELVAIPSVSTNPENRQDMRRAAQWLVDKLTSIGCQQAQIFETPGHPVVFAHALVDPQKPTVLIYGHYDVQPVDPVDLWRTEPFVPTVDGENLFGRGASDMKGQVLASIRAVEAMLKTGTLPLNVKFILEGEEEIGSPNLVPWLRQHTELLSSNFCLNPDVGMVAQDLPTIVYALRGLAYFELRVYGPGQDLHSGVFGGVVHNPAQALCELIAGMHDTDGRITLPGFYDSVRELPAEERQELARLPINDDYYLQQTGATALYGEKGYTPVERVGARPTLDVNGLLSGFTGEGSKTVIPAWAMAKISMRLVPDQDPKEVKTQLEQYLAEHCPDGIRWELKSMAGGKASMSDPHHPGAQALARALETVWGIRPVFKREGGSIPVVGDMQEILGVDSVLTGFGLPDDNIHSPNEKLHLPTWNKGIEALIHTLFNYVALE